MKRQNKYKGVLFDLDGTLLDTIPLIVETFQYVHLKHQGHTGCEAAIRASIGTPLESYFKDYPQAKAREIIQDYIRYNHQRLDTHTGIFLGVIPMLQALKDRQLKMGIVTSKRLSSARHSLKLFDLSQYFDVVIGKESTRLHKPLPDPVWAAMDLLAIADPGELLFVGDSLHDLHSARQAGCTSVIVGWTAMPREALQQAGPDLWIDCPEQLVQWIDTRQGNSRQLTED